MHVGKITWENGASYRGQWKDGKKEGKGEMRRSIVFKGEWKHDNPIGEFEIIIDNVTQTNKIHADKVEDYGSPGSPPSGS